MPFKKTTQPVFSCLLLCMPLFMNFAFRDFCKQADFFGGETVVQKITYFFFRYMTIWRSCSSDKTCLVEYLFENFLAARGCRTEAAVVALSLSFPESSPNILFNSSEEYFFLNKSSLDLNVDLGSPYLCAAVATFTPPRASFTLYSLISALAVFFYGYAPSEKENRWRLGNRESSEFHFYQRHIHQWRKLLVRVPHHLTAFIRCFDELFR